MGSIEPYLVGGAALLVLSVLASKATERLGVPALLVFLAIGMLAGSEGVGGFQFDNPFAAQTLGVIALVYILFAGGLETEWDVVRSVTRPATLLSTIGVLLTCVLTGVFTSYLLDFSIVEGVLLGAIISSTDAAAVFTVLRSRNVSLKGRLKPLLELESGSNDPMAVFLTVGLLQMLTSGEDASWLGLIPMFLQQMTLGAAAGYLGGRGMAYLLGRIKLGYDGLYPVMTLGLVLFLYGLTQTLGGNGFLAVYLAGISLGRWDFIHKKSLTVFHNGIAWLMQIAMFLALGLLVFPSQLPPVAGSGLLLSAFLILVARPLGVFITLGWTRSLGFREKLMISWVGLRGAVPIILATYPLLAGIDKADVIFNLIFFIVLTSVLLQGTSIPLVAKWLGVDAPLKAKFRYPIEYTPTGNLKSELVEVEIPDSSPAIDKTVFELGFPKGSLIVLIQRDGQVFVPRGGTQIHASDTLLVLAEREALQEIRRLIHPTPHPAKKPSAS